MAITITSIQEFDASIQPVDAKGNPAPVDGVPSWAVSDPLLVEVVPAEDGMSAVVRAVGPVGVGQVTVTADARIGPDIVPLTGVLDVTVVAAEATALNIVTGVPHDQV